MTTAKTATSDQEKRADLAACGAEKGSVRPDEAGTEIARLLIKEGHLTDQQLRYALRVRSKLATPRTVLSVLLELHLVTDEQIKNTLRANRVSLRLGTLLLELGLIRDSDLKAALAIQREKPGKKLGQVLTDEHFVSEEDLCEVLSFQLGFPYLHDELFSIDERLARRAPCSWYRDHEFVPVREENGSTMIAFADPFDTEQTNAARKIFGNKITLCIAYKQAIHEAVNKLDRRFSGHTEGVTGESTVINAVTEILACAASENASDIHIEPMKNRLRIRFRQDGVLVQFKDLPKDLAPALSSRIKVLVGADIAEKRRHQDGRMLFEHQGISIDLRVSFYVTVHGEKIVLRLLNNKSQLLDLKDSGIPARMFRRFQEDVLDAPSGVVIITGPTGFGKTTTLYSAINYLNNVNTSIITAEDPVEYVVEGISQCSINSKDRYHIRGDTSPHRPAGPGRHRNRGDPGSVFRRDCDTGSPNGAQGAHHLPHRGQHRRPASTAQYGH